MRITRSRSIGTLFVVVALSVAAACSSKTDTSTKYSCIANDDRTTCYCNVYQNGPPPTSAPIECSTAAFAGTVCCADKGWPGTGLPAYECECMVHSTGECWGDQVAVADCKLDGTTTSPTPTTSGKCAYKDPGTNYAPCKKDSDCFGGFCDSTGKPGPYCYPPTANALGADRGYTCKTDKDCNAVLPSDVAATGISGKCQGTSVNGTATLSCSFLCNE
jgi:hypothetical protein